MKGILQALCHSPGKGGFAGVAMGEGFREVLPSQQSVSVLLRYEHWLFVTLSLCVKRISNVNCESVMFY